jgi:hypothetical protein
MGIRTYVVFQGLIKKTDENPHAKAFENVLGIFGNYRCELFQTYKICIIT